MATEEKAEQLKIGTSLVRFTITSEPGVVPTYRGYAPVLKARIAGEGTEKTLFISSRSLTEIIEKARAKNGGRWTGIELAIQKESDDKFAKYILEGTAKPGADGGKKNSAAPEESES